MDREKRGIECDRWKKRVKRRVGGTTKTSLTSDRYHDDHGEKGNPMG